MPDKIGVFYDIVHVSYTFEEIQVEQVDTVVANMMSMLRMCIKCI